MRKLCFLILVIPIFLIGCISPTPLPEDPYIDGPSYIMVDEEAIYRIKNLKDNINKSEVSWVLIAVDNPEVYYKLGKGEECKLVITEEMIEKTYIRKIFELIAYYQNGEKTFGVSKYIYVREKE